MATDCFVLDKDRYLFQKPQPFGKSVEFDISVANTTASGTINVTSLGPGSAKVELTEKNGAVYKCIFSPSVPGRYDVNIKWNDKHIRGSPYTIHFSNKARILVGLELEKENFCVGTLYRFKLNCDGQIDEKDLVASIDPPTAAHIEISQISKGINLMTIMPLEVGVHVISVLYGDRHVHGSPYTVTFKTKANAQNCYMLSSDIGKGDRDQEQAIFVISTKDGGEGSLSAYVQCPGCINQIAVIEEIEPSIYKVYFDIGNQTEYSLVVEYDGKHIKGSPFKLLFEDSDVICQAEGEGLHLSEINKESKFVIKTGEDTPICKSSFMVAISPVMDNSKQVYVEAVINEIDSNTLEVTYTPTIAGSYKIFVKMDEEDIAGSPFPMICYQPPKASSLIVLDPPKQVFLNSPVNFKVAAKFIRMEDSMLTCVAQHRQTLVDGKVYREESDTYTCSLSLPQAAKYKVNVTLHGTDIEGSPFKVIAVEPPRPEKCKAYGPGIKDGYIKQQGMFTIDTNDAGSGKLNVKVQGPKKSFRIEMKPCDDDKRKVNIAYNPTHSGKYRIIVTWADIHIPGSPFHVTIHEGNPSVS